MSAAVDQKNDLEFNSQKHSIRDSLDELKVTQQIIWDDFKQAQQHFKELQSSQYCRRNYLRTGFSAVEATLFGFRKLALILHEEVAPKVLSNELSIGERKVYGRIFRPVFSPAELCLLREEIPYLDDGGTIHIRPNFMNFKAQLKFTFSSLYRMLNLEPDIDYSKSGWSDLCKACSIRNSITHPKGAKDLTISDKDMSEVCDGFRWFELTAGFLFQHVANTLVSTVNNVYQARELS